jgi:hypothetical protein
LIDLLLPLRGYAVNGVYSHVGIGGEFCHFVIFVFIFIIAFQIVFILQEVL